MEIINANMLPGDGMSSANYVPPEPECPSGGNTCNGYCSVVFDFNPIVPAGQQCKC